MSSFLWWRSWHDAPMDHKWSVIAARANVKTGIVSAIAWALMDYASQHKDRGTIEGFDTETYAVYSGFSEEEIKAVIQAMTDKKIIAGGKLVNWEKRQPKREDDSTERVREFRDRKHSVTQSNAENKNVTIDSVSVSESISESELKQTEVFNFYDVERLYRDTTGFSTVPPSATPMLDGLLSMLQDYGWDASLARCKSAFAEWSTRKRKDNGKPYSPTNPKWIEWAISGEVDAAPESDTDRALKQMSEQAARFNP